MRKSVLLKLLLVSAFLWAGGWLVSNVFWYEVLEEHGIEYETVATLNKVEITVWANGTTNDRHRAWWFPLVINRSSRGPFAVGIRLIDASTYATSARVHSASLRMSDGSVIPLTLTGDRDTPEQEWWPFFMNATERITHFYHLSRVEIDGPATLELDLSLARGDSVLRRQLSLPFVIRVRRINRWGFVTA